MNEAPVVTAGRFGRVSVSRFEQPTNILLKFVAVVNVTFDRLILLSDLQPVNNVRKLF
jgi:hypothetical protein